MKGKLTILFLCLLVLGLAQNECQESRLTLLQTGQIVLNTNDLGNAGANKNYIQSLERGKFGKTDFLGHAFAIAGFETTCTQKFYSLVVDVVQFQNQNTKMRIVVDFRNQALDTLTTWTKVKLSYLVVSAERKDQGQPQANIWATSADIVLQAAAPAANTAYFKDDIFAGTLGNGGCGLTYAPGTGYTFDVKCDTVAAALSWDRDVAIHAYIMGFRYQPDTAGKDQFLAASAAWGSWPTGATDKQVAVADDQASSGSQKSALTSLYGVRIVYDTNVANVNGPKFSLSNYGGELKSIKIGIVLTTIMPISGPKYARNGFTSALSYSYSGLYNPVPTTAYNIRTLIDDDDTKDWNNLHEKLPVAKYKIYGFSRFELKDGSGCSSFNIDLNIDTPNSYTLTLNNKEYVNNVVFQSDIFFPATRSTCSPGAQFNTLYWDQEAATPGKSTQLTNAIAGSIANLKYMKNRISQKYTTVPSNNLYQTVTQIKDNPLNLQFSVKGIASDKTNVRLNAQVTLNGITSGKPYGIRIYMKPSASAGTSFHNATDGTLYQFSVKVNGLNLYTKSFTHTQVQTIADNVLNTGKSQERYGVNLIGTTAKFEYSLIIPRNPADNADYDFRFDIDMFQFVEVYDPVTQCCVSKCPASTGLDVDVTPPVCVECDSSKGLTTDPSTGSCKCADTFYLDTKLNFQCFPCQTKLCATCDTTNPKKCTKCLTGAALSTLDSTCSCTNGFFENNGVCTPCAAKCSTCKVATTCDTCSDTNRDLNNGCNCIAGFYDAGVDKCQKCSPSCATCSNANTCVTCDPRKFRAIKNGLCVCQDGYFELIYENNTRECKPCTNECKTCVQSATQCTSCDSTINRVQGYDSLGRRTCVCRAGYRALPDGSCVQSNCKTDDLCSQCEKDLALCVQCRATLNRVLKLPESICVCADGFYEDNSTKTCKPCSDGCAQCTSPSRCTACVAGSTPNNDGTCKCSNGTFFGIATNGVRYCQKCIQYCDQCNNALTCQVCKSPFQLSSDNTCFCPKTNWINPNGECVPCKTGCETCASSTTCSKCVAPLVLQQNNCVGRCSEGYFLSGSTCVGCPQNCVGCTATNQCFYCKDGFFLHGGACYTVCPSGTVANNQTYQCVPCNSPCRTCTNHPSSCTSCEPGEGYLQVTGTNQRCVKECAEGTFPKDNVCQVCDFRCAKCLGAANNCIACPTGRFLYNGACWDYCPGILVNNSCVNSCPPGFWRVSDQQCKPCNSECSTCDSNATCLTCANNFLSLNGKCVASCGDGYYSFRGLCVACDKSCKSCRSIPTQCVDCAAGYVRLNEKCVNSCSEGTYLDSVQKQCRPCNSACKTCTSENFCLTCPNANILPVGGQCLSCIYPCETCSKDLSVCNSCLSGFFLSDGQCLRTCPSGTRPVNGVCSCASGIFLDGACVSSCPSGYTRVGNSCRRCISPCTECSGNQNFCTDCLDTFTLKPNTGKCEQTSSCNFGQEQSNGKCERICEQGSYYQNGACIFGGCADGFRDNGFGGCVVSSSTVNVCQVPTFRLNSVCVEDCGRGFFPNTNSRTCDACSTNCLNCLDRNFCVACATGFTAVDGKCVANSNCPANRFSFNSACVASCPIGTYTSNGRCVRSCAAGSYSFGGWCYDTCPTEARLYTDNACVAQCPTGTTLVDNVCATVV